MSITHKELSTRFIALGENNPKETPTEVELAALFDSLLLRVAGSTGTYEAAPMNEDDLGGLAVLMKPQGDKLLLEFGKPITFVGLTFDNALQLVQAVGGWVLSQKKIRESQQA
jgi:hypothetical protein